MADIRVRFAGLTEREECGGGGPRFAERLDERQSGCGIDFAVIALAGYAWVDKRYLRCPHCGGFENLDRLFYAKHHTYHCRHCGEVIRIGTK